MRPGVPKALVCVLLRLRGGLPTSCPSVMITRSSLWGYCTIGESTLIEYLKMPNTLVIYNPTAGRGRAQAHWPLVERALAEAGVEFDAVATRAPLEATALAERAPQSYSSVVGVGGDGTLHEIVNGLLRASSEAETIAVGVVPLGNGHDFAQMIPPDAPG